MPLQQVPTGLSRTGAAGRDRAVHSPLPDLLALADALDAALARRGGVEQAALASVRDAVGDHLVALSAAGMPAGEREAVARSLTELLADANARLRALRSGGLVATAETAHARRFCS
jgi:hypothetical protein